MFPSVGPSAVVLLFNLKNDQRFDRIESYLDNNGIRLRRVEANEFHKPIGTLLGLKGFAARADSPCLPFSEEMLLMCGFDQRMLQDFLSFFHREGLRSVGLKAMLTPTNAAWSACELYLHLSAERSQFEAVSKKEE